MIKYEDILNEMFEIIMKSALEKKDMTNKEIDISKEFTNILGYDIQNKYLDRFNTLVDAERTYSYLNKSLDNMINNDLLINLLIGRKELIVKELINILNNPKDKNIEDVTEYHGYIVCKSDLESFINITKILKVGPFFTNAIIGEDYQSDINRIAKSSIKNAHEQKVRVKEEIDKIDNKVLYEICLFMKDYKISEELYNKIHDALFANPVNINAIAALLLPDNKKIYLSIILKLWEGALIDDETYKTFHNMADGENVLFYTR